MRRDFPNVGYPPAHGDKRPGIGRARLHPVSSARAVVADGSSIEAPPARPRGA